MPGDTAVNSDPRRPPVSRHRQVFGYLLHCVRNGADHLGVKLLVLRHFRSYCLWLVVSPLIDVKDFLGESP